MIPPTRPQTGNRNRLYSSSLHVGFSQIETDNPWRTAQINSFREALLPNGMDFIYHEPEDHSVQWQLEDIRSLIREGVDYLVIVPADLSALTPVLQDAKDAGIPVILIDQSAETIDQSYYVSLISADYLKEGQSLRRPSGGVNSGSSPAGSWKSTAPRAHPEPRRAQKDSIRPL